MSDRYVDIEIRGSRNLNTYEELVKVFLQPGEYRIHGDEGIQASRNTPTSQPGGPDSTLRYDVAEDEAKGKSEDRYVVIRQLYRDLARITGKRPKWGVLTGIRPVKLAMELEQIPCEDERKTDVEEILQRQYLLHPEKAGLVKEILSYQRKQAGEADDRSLSLYIGIPFCPTRCLYCSFTSNQVNDEEIDRYLQALCKEVRETGKMAREEGFHIESVYLGGGTPTTLDSDQLGRLLKTVSGSFDLSCCREFTVEAGRPDTIDRDKLIAMKSSGVGRISINPQSMQQKTLDRIGRKHSVVDVKDAFLMAREYGFDSINTDLIAGLPGEGFDDFKSSLDEILELGPDNITIHTLAVKRASRLKEKDEYFNYRDEELREKMLDYAGKELRKNGFRPYYLYRQKHTSGNTENTGYCREDRVGLYNIRIMEEHQSILALGAGGISKVWFPDENRLERVPNVSNYEVYIERIDEMIKRKRVGFFEKNH